MRKKCLACLALPGLKLAYGPKALERFSVLKDMLDLEVSADRIIECHGTTARVICSEAPQHAVTRLTAADVANRVAQGEAAPRCHCGALLRPAIVFFGEPLPALFHRCSGEDLASCDLLLVIGTALSVYPVAGLVNRVPALTPRLLINREAVGPWREAVGNPENFRDVFFEGECDEGAAHLARELSWPLRVS